MREELVGVKGAFSKEGLTDLAKRLEDGADSVGSHYSAEARADMDYLELKIKDNLAAMIRKLFGVRKAISQAKTKAEIDQEFSSLNDFKVWQDPTISSVIPTYLGINWLNHDKFHPHDRVIKLFGWGFDRPDGELEYKLEIADAHRLKVRTMAAATFPILQII